jgi:hypothetical protein
MQQQGAIQMSFKKLGVALFAVLALCGFMANSAFATSNWRSENEKGQWYVNGSKLTESSSTVDLVVVAVGTQSLRTTVGKEKLDITATTVKAIGVTLKQTSTPKATITGELEFSGLSVTEPAGCSTTSTIKTKPLTATLGMNKAGTLATLQFQPTAGATTAFATVELIGASCPIAGLYKVTGTVYGQATNATNTFEASQEIKLSEAIQLDAGTATSLKFGENSAILTGGVKGTISGAETTKWGGNES